MKTFQLFDNQTGVIGTPTTILSYERKGNLLSFSFEAYESSLNSFSNIDNNQLYKGDVVEIFLDLGDDFYYEFEVAPNGATFVAKILNRQITFIENNFFKSKTYIKGDMYQAYMMIDISKLKHNGKIKFNAFRIETKGIKSEYILQALSPTLCETFHVRDKFIDLN